MTNRSLDDPDHSGERGYQMFCAKDREGALALPDREYIDDYMV